MLSLLLILLLTTTTINTFPINSDQNSELESKDVPEEFKKEISVLSYIENFKNSMAEYVAAQYRNLTVKENRFIKDILENFLLTFAMDMHDSINKQMKNEPFERSEEDREYRLNYDGFEKIKKTLKEQFSFVKEETADDIIWRLKQNLIKTKLRLDILINESKELQATLEREAERDRQIQQEIARSNEQFEQQYTNN